MSTSCGSPCYAAPELVISEGLYVGSAVDIWSCGVILYAMLCGYLPFDDDPANPDGDNINLLYKYILNTELAFPDYVSADARDLLRKMLVPDPAKRCTMHAIMGHPWLRPHRALFEKSLGDLELDALASAELPLPRRGPDEQEPVVVDRHHTPPKSKSPPAEEEAAVAPGQQQPDQETVAVVPSSPRYDQQQQQQQDEQMVPQDDVDRMDIDTVPEESAPPPQATKGAGENNFDDKMLPKIEEQQKEDEKDASQDQTEKDQDDATNTAETEKPTPLAQVDTAARDISSMELPASAHTESMSTTTAEDKEMTDVATTTSANAAAAAAAVAAESPQPTRTTSKKVHQRGTEMIKNLLSVSKASSSSTSRPNSTSSSRRPFSMQAEPPRSTPQPGNSILHAKFLSSVQRHQVATPTASSPPPPPKSSSGSSDSPLVSMSTPNGMMAMAMDKPLPQRPQEPSRTSMYQHRPTPPASAAAAPTQSTSTRGTRRKALSLLVNPMTNQDGDRRTISFTTRRPSSRPQQQSAPPAGRQQQQQQQDPPSSPRPDVKFVVTKEEPRPQSTVSMAPSASDQSTTRMPPSPTSPDTMSREYKHKSAGKKLMDWFKKKPLSTKDNNNRLHADMISNTNASCGTSTLSKPLGSYAVDFKDAKLRTYHGAVDQNALTSRPPQEVLVEVKQTLISMGIDVKDDGEYKLKCVRRRRRSLQQQGATPPHHYHRQQQQQQQQQANNVPSPSPSSQLNDYHKKRRMTSSGPRFRNLLRRTSNAEVLANNAEEEPAGTTTNSIIYGDPVVDPGEEVRFSMEVCKIKNLPGLYIVDIRRMRGNVWSYKFLYHAVLGALDLGGKGGYMSTRAPSTTTTTTNNANEKLLRPPQQQQQQQDDKAHRISMASSSNNSSCVMDDTISEEKASMS
ncbi:hypothetical protein BDB00DRAFT_787399 [Zychaea mexicana]|uniref:uncharacterized protein n=1 Tax=Zychaea mexicana TaxID=64656 RepID=UPI0022FF3E5B|nr:uncharacterized protein BDB00DRAFT_787399 [Zychaea mexicana]KAI9494189.1 hypothetical protein BDB00DRAFT_787399 [Zychaea mexicana]